MVLADIFGTLGEVSNVALIAIFIGLAALFLLMEICTPTFGIMASLAFISLVVGVYYAFQISSWTGFLVILGTVIATPIYLYYLVKLLPKTPIGKCLMLPKMSKEIENGVPESNEFDQLVGKVGTAESLLRPAGTVKIDSKRYPARAQLGIIQPGSKIKVLEATATDLLVGLAES